MAVDPDEMRFSGASIDLLREIKYAANRRVTDRALAHALQQGREVVTEGDVFAVLRLALEEVAAEQVQSDDAQTPAVHAEATAR